MTIDALVLEVGSTITKANGFRRRADGSLDHVAQGFAPTSVAAGDVGVGVDEAVTRLQDSSGLSASDAEVFVNSSAAGGLRMTVHGLTMGMTARAAREAALGAGAIVTLVTAGRLGHHDLERIREIDPSMVLLAGGVDHGDQEVVLANAQALATSGVRGPVLYAGNVAAQRAVRGIFEGSGIELVVTDNVFPDIDELAVEPVRALVHEEFNRHIVHAPGMARLEALSSVADPAHARGGARWVRSCSPMRSGTASWSTSAERRPTSTASPTAARSGPPGPIDPEPRAKRTVEGDLGVFVNARNIAELAGGADWAARLADLAATPSTERQRQLTRDLCAFAVATAARRHAGVVRDQYTPTGRKQVVHGRDLTAVRWVVGTGGALTRVPGGREILRSICRGPGTHLLPPPDAGILIDRDYRFSALGTLAQAYPDEVRATFRRWVADAAVAPPG